MNKYAFFIGILLLLVTASCKKEVSSDVANLLEEISPADISSHITYLADDRLRGRYPGTEGYRLAVDYVVSQLKENHVEPAGDSGTYFQKIRIRRAWVSSSSVHVTSGGKVESLAPNQDYVIIPNFAQAKTALDANLVFAGFGISEPDSGYDDYADVDVKGKVVVVLRGSPQNVKARFNADKVHSAAVAHGAVGVLFVSSAKLRPLRNLHKALSPEGRLTPEDSLTASDIQLYATVTSSRLNQWFRHDGLDTSEVFSRIRAGTPASRPLSAKLRVAYISEYADFESENVLGKVEGSDRVLKNEYLIHVAHLDHVGVGKPVDGDSIYNGAHDNASGVAFTLEIAKVYSKLKKKPKRTVIFNFVTAEEIGMLGSAYFAAHPTVEKQNIVAAINIDMPTIIAPLLSVSAIGSEHSSLLRHVIKAGEYLHIDVEPDPEPEQNRFVRSDQFNFVKEGIPALRINNGNKTADSLNNLKEKAIEWRAKYYHKPQDDANGIFDFEAAKSYVQFNFLLGYFVAQDRERPTWNKNSIYKK
jgi:Zn-dependent M28 family amino/carboxypeptidase